MKLITRLLSAMLLCSIAPISIAADELGEICFSGSFKNTGDCLISVEATLHGKYISLNGLSHCNAIPGKEGLAEVYNGIVHGNGYVDEQAIYHGALDVFTVANNDMMPKSLLFWIDLNALKVQFKATTDGTDFCNPFQNCESLIDFDLVKCP